MVQSANSREEAEQRHRIMEGMQGHQSPFEGRFVQGYSPDRTSDADYKRRMAEEMAAAGHRGRGPRGYQRSNDRISEDVCDRLTDDHAVDAREIQVTVTDGVVTLTGVVDDRAARRRAEDIADSVSGVRYVMNNIRVRQPGTTGATG
jgi:osmotically-inducible protein OsmY